MGINPTNPGPLYAPVYATVYVCFLDSSELIEWAVTGFLTSSMIVTDSKQETEQDVRQMHPRSLHTWRVVQAAFLFRLS